ncbi:MAG: hypothetical protein QXK19_00240 [Nitrososphaerota archaeon]
MEPYLPVSILLTSLISIIIIIWAVGEIRSKENPRIDFRIERYIISHKYAFPSPYPLILVGYYNRLENSVMLSISSIILMVWRKILKENVTDSEILERKFINEFTKELNTVLIHELTEWAIHQLELKRILTHATWNPYIRKLNE